MYIKNTTRKEIIALMIFLENVISKVSDLIFNRNYVYHNQLTQKLNAGLGMMCKRWSAPALSSAQIKKKGACTGDEKPTLIQSCVSWYCPQKILKSSSRIYFNWYNRVNFKLILLTLIFKSLFFKTNLNCTYFLLLDIFSIITQWGFRKCFIKTDIFNKSGFRSEKLIVIV